MEREERPRKVFQWNQKQWFNQKCWLWELGFSTVFEIKKKKKASVMAINTGNGSVEMCCPRLFLLRGNLRR